MAGLEGKQLGSYEILQRVGSGGMAEVYRAKQLTAFGREVAIKVVRAGYSEDPGFRERFLREAQAISKLSHPNILPLIEFGEQEEMLYLVMPLAREGTLRTLLQQRKGPLPLEEALSFFLQLCNAVHYAHTQGIIHRDIKPQNVLLQQGTHLLLADFGIARDTSESRMTTVGVGMGTVEYMAPEQALGQADARSDIYSLGIVLYQLLTGKVPYTGSTPFQTLQKHSTEPLPDPRASNPTLPAEAIEVLETALAKDPKDRFQTAQALARAIQQIQSKEALASLLSSGFLPPMANPSIPPATPPGSALGVPQTQGSTSDPAIGGSGQSSANTPGGLVISSPSFPPPPSLPQGTAAPTSRQQGIDTAPTVRGNIPPIDTAPTVRGNIPPGADPAPGNSTPSWSGDRNTPTMANGPQPPVMASGPQPPLMASGPQPPLPGSPVWSGSAPRVVNRPYLPTPPGTVPFADGQQQMPSMPPGPARRPRPTGFLGGFLGLSLWQRFLFGGLACLVIVGSVAAILLAVHRPTTAPTRQITSATQTITRYGAVNVATMEISASTPQAQLRMAARLRTATPPSIPTHIGNLPALPTSLEIALVPTLSAYPATLPVPGPLAGFKGIGQAQLGIDAPMDISVANNGTATIEVVDGAFLVANAATVKVISLAVFFQQLVSPAVVLGESRVFFDADLGKWILISNQISITKDGAISGSALDLAISVGASPLDKWNIYQFSTSAHAYAGCNWADYPQIGINGVGVFITGTSFACGAAGRLYGASLWELPKQQLSAGTIESVFVVTGFTTASGDPIVTLTPAVESGKDSVEWLVSNDAGYVVDGQVSQHLYVWAVAGGLSGAKQTPPTITTGGVTLPQPYADPPLALQSGSAQPLATGDARIVQAQLINSHLFAAFTTAINWGNDPVTRAGISWVDLLPTLTNAAAAAQSKINVSIHQQGFVGDPSYYFYSPSFVADSFGNVVLLAIVSGLTLDPHLMYTSRLQSDPLGTLGGVNHQYFFLPLANTAPYKGSHWGDYGGAYAAPVLPGGKSQFLWVAGAHVDSISGWETTMFQIPTRGA